MRNDSPEGVCACVGVCLPLETGIVSLDVHEASLTGTTGVCTEDVASCREGEKHDTESKK